MEEIPKEGFKTAKALKANPRCGGGKKEHLSKVKMVEN